MTNSPLRRVRKAHGKTLQDVADAVGSDSGNLSRIERGMGVPSRRLAERLVQYFGGAVTEIELLYPERFMSYEIEA